MSYPTEKIPNLLAKLKGATDKLTDAKKETQCDQEDVFLTAASDQLHQYTLWLQDLLADPNSHGPHPCETCPSWKPIEPQ